MDDGENLDLRRGSLDSISDDERLAWHDEFPCTGDTARSAPIRMVRQIGRALADILMNPSRGARIMIMDVLVDPFEISKRAIGPIYPHRSFGLRVERVQMSLEPCHGLIVGNAFTPVVIGDAGADFVDPVFLVS